MQFVGIILFFDAILPTAKEMGIIILNATDLLYIQKQICSRQEHREIGF
jgi:hypothetical protein